MTKPNQQNKEFELNGTVEEGYLFSLAEDGEWDVFLRVLRHLIQSERLKAKRDAKIECVEAIQRCIVAENDETYFIRMDKKALLAELDSLGE